MIKQALKDRDLEQEEEWGVAIDLTNLKLPVVQKPAVAKVADRVADEE